ncbi:MAG: hypothetical protein R3E54_04250 [Halioglobus sp.]
MIKIALRITTLALACTAGQAVALSMAPEEFVASRQLACVLAMESLGQLSEEEYGNRTHSVLDGFDESEQGNILAKALGYYDGLMFEVPDDVTAVNSRLENFIASGTCSNDYRQVTLTL